jgi:hypothetical protein
MCHSSRGTAGDAEGGAGAHSLEESIDAREALQVLEVGVAFFLFEA